MTHSFIYFFNISTGFNLSDSNQVIPTGGGGMVGQAVLSCSLVAGARRKYPEMCSARDRLAFDKSQNIC